MSLNDVFLREVQERLDAASAGPWLSFIEGRDFTSGSSFIQTAGDDLYLAGGTVADQDFVAHARQDVQSLLDEVRRLTRSERD